MVSVEKEEEEEEDDGGGDREASSQSGIATAVRQEEARVPSTKASRRILYPLGMILSSIQQSPANL